MIELTENEHGLVLPVHAQPGARRNGILGEHDGRLKIAVTEKPDKGKANQAIIALLARQLRIAKSDLRLLSGDTNRRKRFLIVGLDAGEVRKRLGIPSVYDSQ